MTKVTIYSAKELSKELSKSIESYVAKEFGEKEVSYVLDESLIAGIKIASNDKQVELNLSDFLDNLGKSL